MLAVGVGVDVDVENGRREKLDRGTSPEGKREGKGKKTGKRNEKWTSVWLRMEWDQGAR